MPPEVWRQSLLPLPPLLQYYTIAVGKLNPAKMANFMEIDIFVLVACPENSLVDSQVVRERG